MNKHYITGFIKAAKEAGLTATETLELLKISGSGIAPTLMGALPGAALGGYLGYDRARDRNEKEPGSVTPNQAGILGALIGAGAGGLAGAGAGSIGFERGIQTATDDHKALLDRLAAAYGGQ